MRASKVCAGFDFGQERLKNKKSKSKKQKHKSKLKEKKI